MNAQRTILPVAIAPGDSARLVATLRQWLEIPAMTAEMGAKARAMLEMHYTRRQELSRWRALLAEIA